MKPTHLKRAKQLNAYYIEVIVNYGNVGMVKLFFSRFSKRSKWRLILTTDLDLSFHQALKIYNNRWTIEVMFKECKQLLNLGKCQSNDFDAQIADTTITMIQYILLTLKYRFEHYETKGALFNHLREGIIQTRLNERLWGLFIELLSIIDALFD